MKIACSAVVLMLAAALSAQPAQADTKGYLYRIPSKKARSTADPYAVPLRDTCRPPGAYDEVICDLYRADEYYCTFSGIEHSSYAEQCDLFVAKDYKGQNGHAGMWWYMKASRFDFDIVCHSLCFRAEEFFGY